MSYPVASQAGYAERRNRRATPLSLSASLGGIVAYCIAFIRVATVLAAVAPLFLPAGALASTLSPRIVDESRASTTQFPWQVFSSTSPPRPVEVKSLAGVSGNTNAIGGTVHWSAAGPASVAGVERRARQWLRGQRRMASAASDSLDPPAVRDPQAGIARHPLGVSWYRRSPASFFVNPALPGARFEGIVLSELPSGQFYRCSGTLVDSPNGSVVLTAGHCLFNRELAQRFAAYLFVPYAQQGVSNVQPAAPYGVWPAVAWGVTRDWYLHGNARHIRRDVGVLLLARNASGETLGQVLGGGQRISFDAPGDGRAELVGYPATGSFTGNDRLVGCGPRPMGRFYSLGRGPLDVALACDMTLGVSGGPWLQHVSHGVGTVIAVESAIAAPYPWTYGALLDGTDKQLFTSVDRRAVPIR